MQTKTPSQLFLVAAILLAPQLAFAQLAVSNLLTDHAVLQSDTDVPVWGRAEAGAEVTVEFANQKKTTTAATNGTWSLSLDPLTASFEPAELNVSTNKETITLTDILVGEVWICSGQSNMQMSHKGVPELRPLVRQAKHIRSFHVKRTVAFEEAENVTGTWRTEIPDSAVAFSFAHFLQAKSETPVGIILSCWGSSSLEAWMPRDMVDSVPHFKAMMDNFDADTKTRKRIESILNGKQPWPRADDIFLRRQTNILYNAMLHPLAPYACRGLVWYQGERNAQTMKDGVKEPWYSNHSGMLKYGETLKKWIQRNRKQFRNDEMQFLIVMLPGYGRVLPSGPNAGPESPDAHSWAWMRESQLQVLDLPNTAIANTIDLGDVKNIHPKDKLPIGQRLALLARTAQENESMTQGPSMTRVESGGEQLTVHFENADGLKTVDGSSPTGFWICDASIKWVPANAAIKGETVVLSSAEIEKPLHVRYAFAGKPKVNLVNGADLPTLPFRSDSLEPVFRAAKTDAQ